MREYILDTNFFINRQREINLGDSKEAVIAEFVKRYQPLLPEVVFLTTPESFDELKTFFENPKDLDTLSGMLSFQSPSLSTIEINGTLFADIIAETGKRLYRGMRATEDIIKILINDTTKDARALAETYIAQLRKRYRAATREGFIDSTVDLGLILLAKERDAAVVSSDNGLIVWARKFGVKECTPEVFLEQLNALGKTK